MLSFWLCLNFILYLIQNVKVVTLNLLIIRISITYANIFIRNVHPIAGEVRDDDDDDDDNDDDDDDDDYNDDNVNNDNDNNNDGKVGKKRTVMKINKTVLNSGGGALIKIGVWDAWPHWTPFFNSLSPTDPFFREKSLSDPPFFGEISIKRPPRFKLLSEHPVTSKVEYPTEFWN